MAAAFSGMWWSALPSASNSRLLRSRACYFDPSPPPPPPPPPSPSTTTITMFRRTTIRALLPPTPGWSRRRGRSQSRRRFFMARASSSTSKDHYSTLNLTRDASLQEIKAAYRNLARKYHPDINKSPGAEEKFKEISAAYEVLSDNDKRSLYDRLLKSGFQAAYGDQGAGPPEVDPFDLFNGFFGQSNAYFGGEDFGSMGFAAGKFYKQNLDIWYNISLSFEEAIFGGKKVINLGSLETCDGCHGTGAKSKSSVKSCSKCGGKGGIMRSQRTPFGVVSQVTPCPQCEGTGKIITGHCKKCSGEGSLKKKRSVEIDIPSGVNSGITMQIPGEGNYDSDRGIRGDLYLFFHVHEKPGFRRDGLNICSTVCVHYTDAILGTFVQVETVVGYRDLQIPAGTQPGDTLKIRNLGVPRMKNPSVRGDHLFSVAVEIPKKISEAERALVNELALLRKSSEGQPIPSKESNKDRNNMTQRPFPKEFGKLWSSLEALFRNKKSNTRFVSVTLETQLGTGTYCCSSINAKLFSLLIIFILVHIYSSISRIRVLLWEKGDPPLDS